MKSTEEGLTSSRNRWGLQASEGRLLCQSCHGSAIRKLSLVYESGLTFTSSSMAGVGGGLGGVGIGVGRSKGTHVTAVAMKAAPPLKKRPARAVSVHGYLSFSRWCKPLLLGCCCHRRGARILSDKI
jgi:hypothetical protein